MPKLPMLARLAATILIALAALPACATDITSQLDKITLPPGFSISVYAEVPAARTLAVVDGGRIVYVGSRRDTIHAVVDDDGDRRADRVIRVKNGLKMPNGIVWHDGHLYVAEQHRIVRYAGNDPETVAAAEAELLTDTLPDKRRHGWRYAALGPDGQLYVAIGAPCNICALNGIEGTIIRLPLSGGAPEIYASGVRNSVGLDFHPRTGDLYFTDNGADHMGDESPPDELNRATVPGQHFGYPFFGGGDDRTNEFRLRKPPPNVKPIIRFGAHVAALGVHFYRGTMLPETYRRDAFIAQHGSWNRSVPDGYRVVRIRLDAAGAATYEPFAEGWLEDGRAWGRPVDIAELGDGSLLISDDKAGVIYRITYAGG